MLSRESILIVKWVGRLLALMMLAFGLMFYFGYGNPLPFIDPEYTWLENAWLTLIPMVFIGLAAGWKYEKLGGFLVIIPLLLGSVFAFIAGEQPPSLFAIVLIPAILYLIVGYSKTKILH